MNKLSFNKSIKPCSIILEIANRYQKSWDPQIMTFIEMYCCDGEEGIAFDLLINMLYEVEIEPTEEEKQRLIDLAEEMGMSREELIFWPEPPKR